MAVDGPQITVRGEVCNNRVDFFLAAHGLFQPSELSSVIFPEMRRHSNQNVRIAIGGAADKPGEMVIVRPLDLVLDSNFALAESSRQYVQIP